MEGLGIRSFGFRTIRLFLTKRVNCSFALLKRKNSSFRSFCQEQQEQIALFALFRRTRRAMNIKEHRHYVHPNWYEKMREYLGTV